MARRRPSLIPTVVLLVAAAACTAPSAEPAPPPPSTTTTAPPVTPEQAADDFRACMAADGIDLPEIHFDAKGRPDLAAAFAGFDTAGERFRAALGGCAVHLVAAGALSLAGDPELGAMVVRQVEAFADCMRRAGLDFPDPVAGFDGTGPPFPAEEVPYAAEGFQEAAESCQASLGGTD